MIGWRAGLVAGCFRAPRPAISPPSKPAESQGTPHHSPSADSGRGRNRTGDTRIFSPLLYQLSYPSRLFFPFRRPYQQVCQRTGLPCGRKALPEALHCPPRSLPVPACRQNQLNRHQEAKGGPSDQLKGTAAEHRARLLLVERKRQSHERHDDDRCHGRHCDASPEHPPPPGGRWHWFALGLQLAGAISLFILRQQSASGWIGSPYRSPRRLLNSTRTGGGRRRPPYQRSILNRILRPRL